MCEHCNQDFIYKELTNHYQICLEYPFPCPNNCSMNLKRKLLDSHLELECPNMVVECPYKKFGCREEVLRRDLEEHKKTNQIQHLESASIFAACKMEELKQRKIQLTITNKQLTETMKQLKESITTLENEVENLSYPTILRDELVIPNIRHQSTCSRYSRIVNWKFLKIRVEFDYSSYYKIIPACVIMENDVTDVPPTKCRFKLTITGKRNKCHIYESDLITLQPRIRFKDGKRYPSEFLLARIPREDFQDRFLKDLKCKFTLQIQEI